MAKKTTKKKEEKIVCPHCNKDLKKVGFYTFEEEERQYQWSFSRKLKYFNSRAIGSEGIDGEIRAECRNCGGELDWWKLSETGLV